MDDLYRRYAGWLKATLRRQFAPDQAEDLVQEAYIRLAPYQAAGGIRHPQGLLLRIAQNLAYNQARRAGRERRRDARFAETSQDHGHHADAEQTQVVLYRQILEGLPTAYRDVFVLNRHGGLTYEQIAAHCDLPLKTVEWRMSKALALIAARMRD
ncbi:RNA polymerase sigma factor [Phenylobacterium sp.]|uniref:RNA polymerase sigma factor n=1 Tax=Phenylobacterium sp. TaxID=1871053 RepID=UPI0035AFEDB0